MDYDVGLMSRLEKVSGEYALLAGLLGEAAKSLRDMKLSLTHANEKIEQLIRDRVERADASQAIAIREQLALQKLRQMKRVTAKRKRSSQVVSRPRNWSAKKRKKR